jgi:hypothetical protein
MGNELSDKEFRDVMVNQDNSDNKTDNTINSGNTSRKRTVREIKLEEENEKLAQQIQDK